jgi:hypothetical protein
MFKASILFLALALTATAQVRRLPSPIWTATPYEFRVTTEAFDVKVVELIRDGVLDVEGKMLVRMMRVRYHVPTSDLAEDRATAILLGASTEDAALIDTVTYSGASWKEQPKTRYAKAAFYAGDQLIASQEIGQVSADDEPNIKAARIYDLARALYEQERKKKPGANPAVIKTVHGRRHNDSALCSVSGLPFHSRPQVQ